MKRLFMIVKKLFTRCCAPIRHFGWILAAGLVFSAQAIAVTVTASPTLCANDASIGVASGNWTGLTNVGTQNNVYAQASVANSDITNYLKCTGYGFSIPAGSTVTGITVGPWLNATYTMFDNAMQLVKGGVIQPTNLATGATIPNGGGTFATTPTQFTYGNSTNLWGNTWTAADISSANFGAAFAAQRGGYSSTQQAGVDAMPITIDYTLPVGGGSGGGSCTTSTVGSDTVITCTGNGSIAIPSGVTSVRYLVVGGGGGGGGNTGGWGSGAGGAGGVLNGTGFAVTGGATYTVTVGAGGSGGKGGVSLGSNGGSSTFSALTASGGGGGASQGVSNDGANGGSGGSGRGNGAGGTGIAGQGNNGGDGLASGNSAGGGGGAGAIGATPVDRNGGSGGSGVSNNISGAAITYGVGGNGGGRDNTYSGGNGAAGTPNAGNGGDGTPGGGGTTTGGAGGSGIVIIRYTTAKPQPLATYHMDEASWNGTANEVTDSSGNGYNAQSFNSSATDGATSAIAGSPGTCRYGVFDNGTTITSGYIQTPLPNLATDFTVTAWVRTTNNAATGQRILIDDQSNSGGYGISLGDGGTGRIRFYSRAINPVILDSTYTIANNTWYFVAAVADITNRIRTLYVFDSTGALLGSNADTAAFTGTWGTDAGPVSIGGETNASGESPANFHFRGNLDEVQVFKAALNQTQLTQIATQTHPCAVNVPDHLEIDHPSGTGVTCTPSTVTIKACANAACTAPYTAGVIGTLSPNGGTPTVNWSGGSGFSIPSGSSTVTKNVQVTTVGSVVFNAVGTPSTIAATTCNFSTTCTFTAADSILLVTAPNHVAETLSALTIQAVKSAPGNPLVCVPGMTGTKTVNLKCAYANPAPATGTLPVRVGGTALNSANNPATACDTVGGNVSMTFDATGTATPALQYADVGQMNVSAAYTGSAGSLDAGLSMIGTGSFTAAPASFSFSGITAGPIKAGNNFSATITAQNSVGATTPNFGKETTAEGVTLSFSKCQPTGTNSSGGTFSGSVGSFSGGVANATNLNWNEVGNGDLVATLASGSYLGSGLTVTGNTGTVGIVCNGGGAGNVGRFMPDHFDTVVTAGTPCPSGLTCPTLLAPNDRGFVYSGQPFTANVYARNASGGTTVNYDGTANTSPNFAKPVTLTAWGAPGSTTTNNPPNASGSSLGYGAIPAVFSKGTTFLGTPATLVYTFGTAPLAPTDIYIRAADTDATSLRATPVEGGVKVVSGKVQISNAHGSEVLPLPMTATVQYWNGTYWLTSSTDSVTQFNTNANTPGGNIVANTITGLGGGISVATPGVVTVSGGMKQFILNPPGVRGSADISLNAPVYLLGGSNGASANPSKVGRATFGIYKGPSQFIYRREDY
jgi:MSHA biogenesis protein MshQ